MSQSLSKCLSFLQVLQPQKFYHVPVQDSATEVQIKNPKDNKQEFLIDWCKNKFKACFFLKLENKHLRILTLVDGRTDRKIGNRRIFFGKCPKIRFQGSFHDNLYL